MLLNMTIEIIRTGPVILAANEAASIITTVDVEFKRIVGFHFVEERKGRVSIEFAASKLLLHDGMIPIMLQTFEHESGHKTTGWYLAYHNRGLDLNIRYDMESEEALASDDFDKRTTD